MVCYTEDCTYRYSPRDPTPLAQIDNLADDAIPPFQPSLCIYREGGRVKRSQHQKKPPFTLDRSGLDRTMPRYARAMFAAVSGNLRKRLPFAANNAFATAGPISAVAGSPMPPGFSVLSTITTSILGV